MSSNFLKQLVCELFAEGTSNLKIDVISLSISGLVLVLLVLGILYSPAFNRFDQRLHQKLVKTQKNIFWKIIAFINEPKLVIVWDVLIAGILINEGDYKLGLWTLLTLGVTDGAGYVIKHLVKRGRPRSHLSEEEGYSFPSGHVIGATTMCLILYTLLRRITTSYLPLILLIYWAFVVVSRLNLRAHYPSDVLGAVALSVFCFTVMQTLYAVLFLEG